MIDCTQVEGIKPQFYDEVDEFIRVCCQIEQFISERESQESLYMLNANVGNF